MGGSVAPGEIIAISGTALGTGFANASMQNTTVTFDGVAAPLLSVTTTQITAIVPFEVNSKTSTQVQVTTGSLMSPPVVVPVVPAAPGIYTLAGTGTGQGAVLNQDGSVNSPTNPAVKGSVISIYATGGGQTNPASATGKVVSSPLPLLTGTPSAAIGGQPAQVTYAGGSPGLSSSIVQVNAIVPASSASGNVSLAINVGGVASQAGVTVWVK
jgi:uncharacterized protein (TIGR03437 family)